jgi:sugar PTS system EIIA component
VAAPLAGTVLPMTEVPDPVVAGSLVGAGMALDPAADAGQVDVVAPVSGRLLEVHPHAFIMLHASGRGVLVHVGIDTLRLAGAPFTLHVREGDGVAVGDRLVTVDVAAVRAAGDLLFGWPAGS